LHDFVTQAMSYTQLLSNHIIKEDSILYPMGDDRMTDAQQEALSKAFSPLMESAFGGKTPAEWEQVVTDLVAKHGCNKGTACGSGGCGGCSGQ